MNDENIFTLEEIKRFCIDYDLRYDIYPESKWEGMSIYEHIYHKLHPDLIFDEDDWEEEIKKNV